MDQEESQTSPTPAEYLTIREAARLIGVADRTVYGYIQSGRLSFVLPGQGMRIPATDVARFRRLPVGRTRLRSPRWRKPSAQNREHVVTITGRIRAGQAEAFHEMVQAIFEGEYTFPGTAGRYVVANGDRVQIILVWRQATMPSREGRSASIATLISGTNDIIEWVQPYLESETLLHT